MLVTNWTGNQMKIQHQQNEKHQQIKVNEEEQQQQQNEQKPPEVLPSK